MHQWSTNMTDLIPSHPWLVSLVAVVSYSWFINFRFFSFVSHNKGCLCFTSHSFFWLQKKKNKSVMWGTQRPSLQQTFCLGRKSTWVTDTINDVTTNQTVCSKHGPTKVFLSARSAADISDMFCMRLNPPAHQDWHFLCMLDCHRWNNVLSSFLLGLNYLTGETFNKTICTSTMSSAVKSEWNLHFFTGTHGEGADLLPALAAELAENHVAWLHLWPQHSTPWLSHITFPPQPWGKR